MTNYVDLDELRKGVYFHTATMDDRFTWERIEPDGSVAEVVAGTWFDGLDRYRLTGCTHKEIYRDGKLCTVCGQANPYEPPAETAARKTRAKKWSTES